MAGLDPDIGTFLARLVRLDPKALVRVRSVDSHRLAGSSSPAGGERVALWGRVPWGVLVTRTAGVSGLGAPVEGIDITVSAAGWLATAESGLSALERRDSAWRGALPASAGVVRETIETSVVRAISAAAESTLRATAAGALGDRSIGERAIRDALLDHVPIVVESDGERIEVPQRLIQAVVRMGFLSSDSAPVHIRTIASWVGVSAAYGVAWWSAQNGLKATLLRPSSRL